MDSKRNPSFLYRSRKTKKAAIQIGVSMQTPFSSEYAIKAINRNKDSFDQVSYFDEGISFIHDGFDSKKRNASDFIINNETKSEINQIEMDKNKLLIERANILAKEFFQKYDGLIIPGNDDDIDPYFYDRDNHPFPNLLEEKNRRTLLEIALVKEAIRQGKPVLGICGGHQVIATVLGAKIGDTDKLDKLPVPESIEKAKDQKRNPGTYPVAFYVNTALYTIIKNGTSKSSSNKKNSLDEKKDEIVQFEFSCHGQAIDPHSMPYILVQAAIDDEGIVKAIEVTGHPWMIGTQYHPEASDPGSEANEAMFKEFLAACDGIKQQKNLKTTLHEELKNYFDVHADAKNKYDFLTELFRDANDPKWNNKGKKIYSLIYAVPPDGFLKLREILQQLQHIQNNDQKILNLFIEVHRFLNDKSLPLTGFLQSRDPEVQDFWQSSKQKCDMFTSPEYKIKTILKPRKT